MTEEANADARDAEAVNSVLSEHVAAVNSGNADANMAGFADDIVYLPPDAPPMRGRDALDSAIRFAVESIDADVEMTPEETVIAGDWAFQWGKIAATFHPLGGGASTSLDGKWLYVYKRQVDGSWKIARDIYNSNVPASTSTAALEQLNQD